MATCGVTFTEEKRAFEIFGTVKPASNFNSEDDAKALNKATAGLGTDEKAIIKIVANRSNEQLLKVKEDFLTLFGKDLIKVLEGELSGKFEKVVVARFYGRVEYQAYVLRNAMKGMGTDEKALIDVVCSKTAEELKKISKAYTKMYERDLIKDIESETKGHLRRILVSMATANRDDEDKKVDIELAKKDAQELYDAGVGRMGTDESVFNAIFAKRSFMQLKTTFLLYRGIGEKEKDKKLIFEAIEKEMSGDLKTAFLTIAQYVSDPITYSCQVLYNAMKGMGTDDNRLIRTIVARCEIDLKTVKERFEKIHKTTLENRVRKETSGDYQKMLLALIEG